MEDSSRATSNTPFLRSGKKIPDIGPEATAEIVKLGRWLFGQDYPSRACWEYRYAPSMIARSEAELFGISMPRFAVRVYLDEARENFVNARRIPVFCDQARQWGEKKAEAEESQIVENEKAKRALPSWQLRRNTCIADSVLKPLNRHVGYQVITEKLGLPYGERMDIEGTPYVKHVPLSGGGMCAQAVCFMAGALLHRYASGVYGVAEVTALSSEPNKAELVLTGMTQERIIRYFRHPLVGLNASRQKINVGPKAGRVGHFEEALKAYILSGMPVILPVDSGRVAGKRNPKCPLMCESIFEANDIPLDKLHDPLDVRVARHAVLLVGAAADERDSFLVNDPLHYPFMEATSGQLADAACYADSEICQLVPYVFLPVVPRQVRMPLHSWADPDSPTSWKPGLLEQSMHLEAVEAEQVIGFRMPTAVGKFRLVLLKDVLENPLVRQATASYLHRAMKSVLQLGWPKDRWCWLQVVGDSVWVWDAERQPLVRPRLRESASSLLCATRKLSTGWRIYCTQESGPVSSTARAPEREPEPGKTDMGSALRTSLITSFSTQGIDQSLAHWPESTDVELYAFMQKDCEALLPRTFKLWREFLQNLAHYTFKAWSHDLFRRIWPFRTHNTGGKLRIRWGWKEPVGVTWPVATALDRMAAYADDPAMCTEVARHLHERLTRRKKLHCIGLATFLPEISSRGQKAERAQNALRFAVQLAQQLRSLGHTDLSTVEMVAGSLIDGVWPGTDLEAETEEERDVYVANRMDLDQALDRFCEAIVPVAEEAAGSAIHLAVEMEPGPLYLLGSERALLYFCRQVNEEPVLADNVGVNLDIAHWNIAQIEPADIRDATEVYDRLMHCHISDHGAGHFGDVALQRDRTSHLLPWLTLLSRVGPGHPFSGAVSIELEAAYDSGLVIDSWDVLRELLHDCEA